MSYSVLTKGTLALGQLGTTKTANSESLLTTKLRSELISPKECMKFPVQYGFSVSLILDEIICDNFSFGIDKPYSKSGKLIFRVISDHTDN